MAAIMSKSIQAFIHAFRALRRKLKSRLPYVRRREYRIIQRKYSELIDAFSANERRATEARIQVRKPASAELSGDVCLFVTYSTRPALKPHVVAHIDHLMNSGVKVVLVVNTDIDPSEIVIAAVLLDRLSAAFVRENLGFDFAAWAHAYALCHGPSEWSRLFLVNDSIVGPLSANDFAAVIERVRKSEADLIGLTENVKPLPHVQSFFLVFSRRALESQTLQRLFNSMHSLPTKELVIDVYETRVTQRLVDAGLKTEVLFHALSDDPHSANDTFNRWEELVHIGFPFVKASVLDQHADSPRMKALVPAELLEKTVRT